MGKTLKSFIVFEGTEGSGKSTLMRLISQNLKEKGHEVLETREPGGHPLSEKIRSLILSGSPNDPELMSPWTELLLYEAARAEHVTKVITPALTAKKIVLCDRFTASTLAYQSMARALPWKTIETLNKIATQGLKPDLTLFLDIDPAEGLKRAKDPNRFEEEGIEFQNRVRKGFLKVRSLEKKKWLTLNSEKNPPDILLKQAIKAILGTDK